MRKRTDTRRKTAKTRKKRPVKTIVDPRRSGMLVLMIWTAIALFA
jgi:hypothetical protein